MGKSTFLQDFKVFAMKGNVIDMAVGVVIGGAFGKIVSSLVANVIMPPIGLLVGGVNFTDLKWVMKAAEVGADGKEIAPAVSLDYGQFLQATFDFLIIAFAIFLFIRLITKLTTKKAAEAAPAAPPAPAPCGSNFSTLGSPPHQSYPPAVSPAYAGLWISSQTLAVSASYLLVCSDYLS